LLNHDNARLYTARATPERIQELQWEILENPPYSLNLAPRDFHLLGTLKNNVGGIRFSDGEEVESEVWKWQREQLIFFYAACFDALIKRWDKCISTGGG
jgi:hypothetical protein